VPFLRERLRPVTSPDPKRLAQLLADLDSAEFAVREKATKQLEQLGELAVPAVKQALTGKPPLEARRRLGQLVETGERWMPASQPLRLLRAVEVLERIGTPDAKRFLQELAQGAPVARLTYETKVALERLAKHPIAP